MSTHVYLHIPPVVYELTSEASLSVHADCAGFCTPLPPAPNGQAWIHVCLKAVYEARPLEGETVYADTQCVVTTHRGCERRLLLQGTHALYREEDDTHATVEIFQPDPSHIVLHTGLLEALALERYLLRKDALVLHSAFIEWNEEGIAFTAPSGTGKSTQASLWHRYEKANIINGDRSILVRNQHTGGFRIGSLPFCGSSGIRLNRTLPLKAVAFLEQCPSNRAEAMPPHRAASKLFGETSINQWNRQAVEKSLTLIEQIVGTVPMIRLQCNMEQEAVSVLKDYLNGSTT